MNASSIHGYISRLPDERGRGTTLFRAGDALAGSFHRSVLTSVFQPVRARNGATHGHSAWVRCMGPDDASLSPWPLLAAAADDVELVRFDRLSRTLHALTYFRSAPAEQRLFLSVDRRLLEAVPDDHGAAFQRILGRFGIPTRHLVIDLPRTAPFALIAEVLPSYRMRGFGVAVTIDPTWPEFAERLQRLRPDVVKWRHTDTGDARLRHAVKAAHVAGVAALVTHLQSPAAVHEAHAAEADLMQGRALGWPARRPDFARTASVEALEHSC